MSPRKRVIAALAAAASLFLFAEDSSSSSPSSVPSSAFDAAFTRRTMRLDLFHTGGPKGEVVAVAGAGAVDDGPWAGSLTRLLDDTNLGTHFFEVRDPKSNRVLFSRGYSSLYAEWETTPEFKKVSRTFPESLRFPWPKAPVQVVLSRRDSDNVFQPFFSTNVDPAAANPAPRAALGKVWTVFENGPATEKLDLLMLGEGYAEKDLPKFHSDVKKLVDLLFSYEPFKSRRADFNVRALDLPSAETGVLRPDSKIFRRTPLSAQYGIFGSERYVLTYDDRALREAAAAAPYDFLEILVNDARYGGGGIFNAQATAAVDSSWAEYLFVHEFGHHFAALADEYYTSDVAYETGGEKPEPWEPNVTALKDAKKLKWADLVEAGTPLPTPWEKETFEKRSREIQKTRRAIVAAGKPPSALDELFREEAKEETALLGSMKWSGKVGAFEGAAYEAKGLYRSSADCIMFTRDNVGFCPVCRRAITRIIDQYARP
ncbi:MAG TPA: M64 family metallopeptidase [Thermoanaerobaculia bacterium]|nr:M64 family metallopeptidase [Thermoanaerobaculia bacterium]